MCWVFLWVVFRLFVWVFWSRWTKTFFELIHIMKLHPHLLSFVNSLFPETCPCTIVQFFFWRRRCLFFGEGGRACVCQPSSKCSCSDPPAHPVQTPTFNTWVDFFSGWAFISSKHTKLFSLQKYLILPHWKHTKENTLQLCPFWLSERIPILQVLNSLIWSSHKIKLYRFFLPSQKSSRLDLIGPSNYWQKGKVSQNHTNHKYVKKHKTQARITLFWTRSPFPSATELMPTPHFSF